MIKMYVEYSSPNEIYFHHSVSSSDKHTPIDRKPEVHLQCEILLLLSGKVQYKIDGEVYDMLAKSFMVDFDESGSIGKRYRREDEIGTPFCITYDFESKEDGCVTVRERDSMEQVRIPIAELEAYIAERIKF